MDEVKVKIVGVAPLLMHNRPLEKEEGKKAKRKDEQHDSVKDAEKALYKDEVIGIYAPSEWIEASLRETAKEFKVRRTSLKSTVLASVFVEPLKIPLNKQKYDEIDVRYVRIQRQGIPRSRPRFNSWELEFSIKYDGERIGKDTLKQILEEAGATKGIGDYRPKFGRFKVERFE